MYRKVVDVSSQWMTCLTLCSQLFVHFHRVNVNLNQTRTKRWRRTIFPGSVLLKWSAGVKASACARTICSNLETEHGTLCVSAYQQTEIAARVDKELSLTPGLSDPTLRVWFADVLRKGWFFFFEHWILVSQCHAPLI